MWQAHSWRAITGFARPRKLGFSHQGLHTSVVRSVICFAFLVVSVSHASESPTKQRFGPDSIYNESSIQSRVFGGGDAELGAWPSMAAIVIAGTFPLEDRFFCGGTVISDRWILTAAHCMYDPFGAESQAADIRVAVGISDLQDNSAIEFVVSNIFRTFFRSPSFTLDNRVIYKI